MTLVIYRSPIEFNAIILRTNTIRKVKVLKNKKLLRRVHITVLCMDCDEK